MPGKVSVIGAGSVGSATTFALAIDGTPDEIVLIDLDKKKAKAVINDIEHGSAYLPSSSFKGTNNYSAIKDSELVIITAGVPQKPGQTRLDLISINLKILKSIIGEVKKYAPNSILLVVSNPVDVLTYFAKSFSGFPHYRVIGSGTVLDTARFRFYLSKKYKVSAHNVHAYILGEHGDSSFPVLSNAHIATVPMQKIPKYKKSDGMLAYEEAKNIVYEIVKNKGATNMGIATCVKEMTRAILNDTHEVFPVSSVLRGEYGLKDVAVSTPSILGRKGIVQELEIPLDKQEKAWLKKSVKVLLNTIKNQKRKK